MLTGSCFLEDARLHAVVADPVAVPGHRVVEDDQRQRADRVAGLAQRVHLGDLLVEWAAGELDAERVDGDLASLSWSPSSRSPCRARGRGRSSGSAEHLARVHARVGHVKLCGGAAATRGRSAPRELWRRVLDLDEMKGLDVFREAEDHPVAEGAVVTRAAHHRFSASNSGLGTGGWGLAFFLHREGRSRRGHGELSSFVDALDDERFDNRIVLRRSRDVGAAFQQR
jgi:hypothetical protein